MIALNANAIGRVRTLDHLLRDAVIDRETDQEIHICVVTEKYAGVRMPNLTFNAESHTYRLDGVVIPNVTTVLNQLMVLDRVPEDTLRYARELGTAVHKVCELYDLGTLDYDSVDPVLVPYLDGWDRFLNDEHFVPDVIEMRMHHPVHRYGATPDRAGVYRDDLTMVDIKSGAEYSTVGPQLAAYYEAYNYRRKIKVTKRLAVYLRNDGTYKLRPCTDKADFSTFLACLHLYNWRGLHE